MEVLYEPSTWTWDREVVANLAVSKFVVTCEEQKLAALRAGNQMLLDEEVELDYNERVELGRGMIMFYAKEIHLKEDIGWTPLKVEIPFMVPIPNPETSEPVIWCKCDTCRNRWDTFIISTSEAKATIASTEARRTGIGTTLQPVYSASQLAGWGADWQGLPVVYAGRIDMLAEDKNRNYWIVDWKTCTSLTSNVEFLYLDDQVGSYVWALTKLGLPVKGFVYVEIKKGFPAPPKENKQRRLGCKFSVSKAQNIDYKTYLSTIMDQDFEAFEEGHYNEFLEWLRNEGPDYHRRYQIAKSYNDLKSIEYNIGLEALDMIDPKIRIYPSAGRFGCNFCAFRQPCMEKNDGSDFQYALDTMFERREHYYVRKEASTESKGGE
jgi:hypothetical protein